MLAPHCSGSVLQHERDIGGFTARVEEVEGGRGIALLTICGRKMTVQVHQWRDGWGLPKIVVRRSESNALFDPAHSALPAGRDRIPCGEMRSKTESFFCCEARGWHKDMA